MSKSRPFSNAFVELELGDDDGILFGEASAPSKAAKTSNSRSGIRRRNAPASAGPATCSHSGSCSHHRHNPSINLEAEKDNGPQHIGEGMAEMTWLDYVQDALGGHAEVVHIKEDQRQFGQFQFILRDYARDGDKYVGLFVPAKYVSVYVCPLQLRDGPTRVLLCSCMESRWSILSGFDMSSLTKEEAAQGRCRHADAIYEIIGGDDDDLEQCPKRLDDIPFYSGVDVYSYSPLMISVDDGDHPSSCLSHLGLVTEAKGVLKCTTCPHHSISCKHIKALSKEIEEGSDLEYTLSSFSFHPSFSGVHPHGFLPDETFDEMHQAISRSKIEPLTCSPAIENRALSIEFKPPCYDCKANQTKSGGCMHLVPNRPPSEQCPCGGSWLPRPSFIRKASLTSMTHTRPVDLFQWNCNQGTCCIDYDGKDDAIFNENGKELYTHEVGYLFWEASLPISHETFASHWRKMAVEHERHKQLPSLPSRRKVSCFLWSFFNRMEKVYDNFGCPSCKDKPEVIVLDALTMGISWRQGGGLNQPNHPTTVNHNGVEVERELVGDINSSCFTVVQDPAFKSRLKRLCGFGPRATRKGDKWSPSLLDELIAFDVRRGSTSLDGESSIRDLLILTKVWCQSNTQDLPGPFKLLLDALGGDYSITGIVTDHTATVGGDEAKTELMIAVKDGCRSDQARASLMRISPIVFQLLVKGRWTQTPTALEKVMMDVQSRIRMASSSSSAWSKNIDDSREESLNDDWQRHEEGTSFAPSHPPCRYPGQYAADNDHQSNTAVDNRSGGRRDTRGDQCTKHKLSHCGLSPGFLLMFCIHGFCLGMKMMGKSEGPRTVFEWIYMRFKTAPRWIIYDNACNLHRYCLRRRPQFFAESHFYIDRLHWWGHCNCHDGYNLNRLDPNQVVSQPFTEGGYSFPEIRVKELNTQVCEQTNSKLASIRTQVAYMKQANALEFVKYYLHCKNLQILKRYKM